MKQRNTHHFFIIAAIGVLLAVGVFAVLSRSADEKPSPPYIPQKTVKIIDRTVPAMPPVKVEPPQGQEYFEQAQIPMMEEPYVDVTPKEDDAPMVMDDVVRPKREGKARIAIIIDDVGMDIKHSKAAIELPAPVTLAMLPYAPRVKEFASAAKEHGHTLIIHAPMEAMDEHVNIGPGGLKESMDVAQIKSAVEVMLSSFEGYEGINNHMGSRLTQDKDAMGVVMKELKRRDLFFIDSKTSPKSVAEFMAAQAGLAHAGRDVFLDNVDSDAFVRDALKKAEQLALSRGYAIAIGHPKEHTLAGLRAWMPTLAAKGIELVSVKELLSQGKEALHDSQVLHSNPLPQGEGIRVENLPQGEGIKGAREDIGEDDFYADVNKAFAPAGGEPEITLHPLPSQ